MIFSHRTKPSELLDPIEPNFAETTVYSSGNNRIGQALTAIRTNAI